MDPALDLMEFLARGDGPAIAANSRASRALRRAYARWQASAGASAWNSAPVFDWTTWMTDLWGDYLFIASNPPLLLSKLQEFWLWKRVLATQPESKKVLSLDALASLAQQAYSLLADYGTSASISRNRFPIDGELIDDAEAFSRWAVAFEAECDKRRVASPSRVEALLREAIRGHLLPAPKELRLIGFDRLTTAQSNLLDAMRDSGCQITAFEPQQTSASRRLVLAQSRREEIVACAAWLRKTLLNNPRQRIAVIAPDVATVRGEVDRTFRRILSPESMDITASTVPLPFEFSLGLPLSTVPAARAALTLLRWLESSITAEDTSWLLLSGFVAVTDTEGLELASVDSRIRNSGLMQQQVSLRGFLTQFRKYKRDSESRLAERLSEMLGLAQGKPLRGPLEWMELARGLLQSAGWPGSAEMDSVEFQARQKWTQTLESMATLGFDGGAMEYSEFLEALARHVEDTIFAPESRDAQVQILGPAESSGQTFDAIWFMGVDESSWPIFSAPHPMIPLAVQRSFGMPHATLSADNEFAGIVTRRIAASAPMLIFSYARQNKDGAMRLSPIVRELEGLGPLQTSASLFDELDLQIETCASDETERTFDSDLIPWPAGLAAGGFTILKRQSACAFQSFAQKRLATGELNDATWGLSPLQRGELLHLVMEQLWTDQSGSQSQLHSLDDLLSAIRDNRIGEMLSLHIKNVFDNHKATQSVDPWSRAYLAGEKRRLHSLLSAWLKYESEREPFVIEALEKQLRDIAVGGLNLNLRVDRVDLLPDGERLLIDYKSGKVSCSMWDTPRLDEPQLPLYATYGGLESIAGIVFAQIRAGDLHFVGSLQDAKKQLFSKLNGTSSLVKNPLNEHMERQWKEDLLSLANDFLRGEASVAPKQYPITCKYCNLSSLCRVKESSVHLGAVDLIDNESSDGVEQIHD